MRTLNYPGAQGTAAYFDGLNLAAHHSMRNTPTAKRHLVSFTPAGGATRGLPECDKRHRDAVKRALVNGPLGLAREEWTEENGDKYLVQEA
jgi:hypothetical protein